MTPRPPTLISPDGAETALPTRWEICGTCQGENFTLSHVEYDGGGFTSSEWAEQDEEFREEYMRGKHSMYARPCPHCEGGKVRVVDASKMSPDQIAAWNEQQKDDAEYDAMCEAERRMGA